MSLNPLQGTRRHLAEQLTFFDEQQTVFLDTYFQEYGRERQQIDRMLREYCQRLETMLGGDDASLDQSLKRTAVIGSSVTVNYLDEGFEEEYTLVYPTEADPDRNRISFLSPIGKHLLLAEVEQELMISSPTSQFRVRLDQIKFTHMGDFTVI